ncbi:transglycosylase domain-containing protein [Fodinisporobacter ferrooxydans]|uniref:Transglycosylase domain-containing protein n=1 Tax=Fodinisporobacter ferrooxydans TaxID=2901836 RepID=A0ABY4CN37_9BACL|nr:transglycosylase domain-containing protein [Alicyclobacillaceae bacterium MYW30-H2]
MKQRFRKVIRRLVLVLLILLFANIGFSYYFQSVFPIAKILDANVHQDVKKHHGTYVPLSAIPQTLQQAMIATEDRRFFTDPGIDPIGIVRSLFVDIKNQHYTEGGSTITQQLIRNVLLNQNKTLIRKTKEVILSIAAYQQISKPQILEYYLNDIYFGQGAYGVENAAMTYFGKPVHELSDAQLTMLAGLPNAPSYLDPFHSLQAAKERQQIILENLVDVGYISQTQADVWYKEPLHLKGTPDQKQTNQNP